MSNIIKSLRLLFNSGHHISQSNGNQINCEKDIPCHIAIIMDGNGRWAKKNGLSRQMGHRRGAKTLKEIVKACCNLGIKYLTVYAFSTENWKRSQEEVDFLMGLLVEELHMEKPEFIKNGIKVRALGDLSGLPDDVREGFVDIEDTTAEFNTLVLNIAVNYGSRQEITNAARYLAQKAVRGEIDAASITERDIYDHLYLKDQPDPDLLIRTSGEYRISNYLLWQIAYTEFYFTEVLWPDFKEDDLLEAINSYRHRDRRFGGRKEDSGVEPC